MSQRQQQRVAIRIGDISPAFEHWLLCRGCHNLMGLCTCTVVRILNKRYHTYVYTANAQGLVRIREPESEPLRFGMMHTRRHYLETE